jgi:hypothetical protein
MAAFDPVGDGDTRLARSGTSSPTGKLTRRLDIPCSQDLEEAVVGMAVLNGVPKAEYVRMVLERHLFGELSMARRMTRGGGMQQWDESRRSDE